MAALIDFTSSAFASVSVMPRTCVFKIVRGFLQRRRRQTIGQCDDAVFDVLIFVDENDEAATRLERHELDMTQARDLLFGEHHSGAVRQPGDQLARFGEQLVDGLVATIGDLCFDLAALVRRDVANLEQTVDEQPQAELCRQIVRRRCAAK